MNKELTQIIVDRLEEDIEQLRHNIDITKDNCKYHVKMLRNRIKEKQEEIKKAIRLSK